MLCRLVQIGLFAGAAFALAGCMVTPPPLSKLAPNAGRDLELHVGWPTPLEMLRHAQAQDARVRTLKCWADVTCARGPFRARVMCQRPGKLRLLASKRVGIVLTLFDLRVDRERISVYVPKERTEYVGELDAVGEMSKEPLATIRVLRDSFLATFTIPADCEIVELPSRVRDMMLIALHRGGVLRQTFEVERETWLIARRSYCDSGGSETLSVRYRDYRRFGDAWFPMESLVELGGGHEQVRLELSRVEVNEPIKPRVFEFRRRRGVRLRPIADLGLPKGEAIR